MTCYSIEPLVHTVKGEGGVYISLFCKLVNEGGKGDQKILKIVST